MQGRNARKMVIGKWQPLKLIKIKERGKIMEVEEKQIDTEVQYGMGAACSATLLESEVFNAPARKVIMAVVNSPQSTEPARRTARVVAEAICSGRTMDVEVYNETKSNNIEGRPIELGDVVISDKDKNEQNPKTNNLTLRVSEPYVGG
jgi:hypothetical protein